MTTFTAPDGSEYEFNGTPTQSDIDSIVSFHAQRIASPGYKPPTKKQSVDGRSEAMRALDEIQPNKAIAAPEAAAFDRAVGVGEGLLHGATGLIAAPAAAFDALGKLIGSSVGKGQLPDMGQMEKDFSATAENLMYAPRTKEGQRFTRDYVAPTMDALMGAGVPLAAAHMDFPSASIRMPKAPRGPNVNPLIAEATRRVEEKASKRMPTEQMELDLFDRNIEAVRQKILEEQKGKARGELEGIYRDAQAIEPQRDMFYPEPNAPRYQRPHEQQPLPFERVPVDRPLELTEAQSQAGLPFDITDPKARPIEGAVSDPRLQADLARMQEERQALQGINEDLTNKTEIGPEGQMQREAAQQDLARTQHLTEGDLARAMDDTRITLEEGKRPYTFDQKPVDKSVLRSFGKKQGGQIHPDLLTFGVNRLINYAKDKGMDFIDRRVLSKFVGTFSKETLQRLAKETNDPKSRSRLVWMSPDDFLEYAFNRRRHSKDDLSFNLMAEEKRGPIRTALKTKEGLAKDNAVPLLYIEDGQIVGHEGRHRMDVFKENGLDLIPVELRDLKRRNGEGPQPYNSIISENGKELPKRWQEMDLSGPPAEEVNAAKRVLGKGQKGSIDFEAFKLKKERSAERQELLDESKSNETSMGFKFIKPSEIKKGDVLEYEGKRVTVLGQSGSRMFDVVDSSGRTHFGIQSYELKPYGNLKSVFGKGQQGSWTPFAGREKTPGPVNTKDYKNYEDYIRHFPEELRNEATLMWKESGGKVSLENPTTKNLEKIPGVKDKLDYMLSPENLDYDVAKQKLIGTEDIKSGVLRNNLASQGQMMIQLLKNPLTTWAIGMVKDFATESRIKIRDIDHEIKQKIASVKKVAGENGLIQIMSAMAKGEALPETVSQKAREMYDTLQKVNDQVYDIINTEYKKETGKDLHKRDLYFNHSWDGPWGFEVRVPGEGGKSVLIDVIREKTKKEATKALEWIQKNATDLQLEVSDIKYNADFNRITARGDGGAFGVSMESLINMVSDKSPEASEARKAYRDHFKHQTGVGGYLGNKPWKSPRDNMIEAVDSFIKYTESAISWAYGKKAQRELNKFINDDNINAPNAKLASQEYYNNAFGRHEQMFKGIDNFADILAEKTGRSRGEFYKFVRNNKNFMTLLTLAYNARFLGTQMMQPIQSVIPKMLEITSKTNTGRMNIPGNFLLAMVDTMGGQFTKGSEGNMLWDYARKNHIIDPRIIEHLESFNKVGKGVEYTQNLLSAPNTLVEKYTRFMAFSALYRTARSVGLDKKTALDLAKNQTETTMTSYEVADRPLIYGKAGILGESASSLQTYKHNQWSSVIDYLGQAKKEGNYGSAIAQIGTQLTLAGLIGFYAIDEIEAIWEAIRNFDLATTGGEYVGTMPSIAEAAVNNIPDYITFGGLSGLTGYDLSGSFSAAAVSPHSAAEAIFPLISKEIDIVRSGFKYSLDPTDTEALGVFLNKALPAVGKGVVSEKLLTSDYGDTKAAIRPSVEESFRTAEITDPGKSYYRSQSLGSRPLDVTKQNLLSFKQIKEDKAYREVLHTTQNKIEYLISKKGITNSKEIVKAIEEDAKISDKAKIYFKLGGDEEKLMKSIDAYILSRISSDPYVNQLSDEGNLRDIRIINRFGKTRREAK